MSKVDNLCELQNTELIYTKLNLAHLRHSALNKVTYWFQ